MKYRLKLFAIQAIENLWLSSFKTVQNEWYDLIILVLFRFIIGP